jgi:CheY-like chemotaxis protein
MAASAIPLVDVASDGPAARERSLRHPSGLAVLNYKMQGMDSVELCGHLQGVRADPVGVLATAFAATVHPASRAGIRQVLSEPVELGRLLPRIEEVAGTPRRSGTEALPSAPAHRRACLFSARRGGPVPVLNPVSAGPATSGTRDGFGEVVEHAPLPHPPASGG